jgi:hypothetical protein
MTKYLPATLGLAAMLMASTALANDVSVPPGSNAANELPNPPLALPSDQFAPVPIGPFISLKATVAEVLPPIPVEVLRLKTLIAQVDSFNARTAKWGLNPMEEAMDGEISTVGGPASEENTIDFSVLNREGLSRLPLDDARNETKEMFSIATVGLSVPAPLPRF